MENEPSRQILVTGATGFIGRALVRALLAGVESVIATSRKLGPQTAETGGLEWRQCDLLQSDTLLRAMARVDVAYYLVHSMGDGQVDYADVERRAAETLVDAAARADVKRVVYLGGPVPSDRPSEHLRSRLAVGEILRAGPVKTVELRASMVIGSGSTSWQIVRDLGMRLPAMILPRWLKSRTQPVAIDDVIAALVAAAVLPLEASESRVSGQENLGTLLAEEARLLPIEAVKVEAACGSGGAAARRVLSSTCRPTVCTRKHLQRSGLMGTASRIPF